MTGPSHPFAELIGMTVEQVETGRSCSTLTVTDDHRNPHGVVHGAVVFALVDTAMGGAAASTLADGQRPATIELQVRFLRPVLGGTLTAEATVVKPGRRVVHLEARVTGDDGRLMATATGSFVVL
jgi:acyl-CoA thioesterase